MRRPVDVLERTSLDALSTRQLLARLERLRRCEESLLGSDCTPDELAAISGIVFKEDARWKRAYDDVRAVLAGREHVAHGPERSAARHARASAGARHGRRDKTRRAT